MMDRLWMEKKMVEEDNLGVMVKHMMVIGLIIICMDKVLGLSPTDNLDRVNSLEAIGQDG